MASTPAVKRRSPIAVFFVLSVAWLVGLTAAWSFVAPWTSQPVAALTHMALEFGAHDWVGKVTKSPGAIEAETHIEVALPHIAPGARGEIVVDAEPQHYAYGLPIFWALLLAGSRRNLFWRALGGYLLLLPAQAFSLTFDLLKQMTIHAAGGVAALGIEQWQFELIGFCYQFGSLVVPTLAPILIWLWMEQKFVSEVLAPAWRRNA